jgi:bifunctional DNA-binding transcriptional regulator/antitoxin component of YhaV-PrlF toxin-antitoxin module
MTTTITMSSKGQFTLPTRLRAAMNLKQGDQLTVDFNHAKGVATVQKTMTTDELTTYLTAKIKPGTKPLHNIDEYYQQHRGEDIR